jgi:hypothetical protein
MADHTSTTTCPIHHIPGPDLAAMTVTDLWILFDAFEHLGEVAQLYTNQPRAWGTNAGKYIDTLWGRDLYRLHLAIADELVKREPMDSVEAKVREGALRRHQARLASSEPMAA